MRSSLLTSQKQRKVNTRSCIPKLLNNLPKLKGSKAKDYYVCVVCGYTTPHLDFSKCPSCFSHKDRYEKVS